MSWNYRVVQYQDTKTFGVHEAYYDSQGELKACMDSPIIVGDSVQELKDTLTMIASDIDKHPILVPPSHWKVGRNE